jgi:NTP pyrophosphatase (non-canonical NTP hydrolase)
MKNLEKEILKFADKRDWLQFHSPKNLSMALIVEAAEVVELFQWMTEEESRKLSSEKLAELKDEIGDVAIYLISLASKFGLSVENAAWAKLLKNAEKYPVGLAKGKSLKI